MEKRKSKNMGVFYTRGNWWLCAVTSSTNFANVNNNGNANYNNASNANGVRPISYYRMK